MMTLGKRVEMYLYVAVGVLAAGGALLTVEHIRWQDQQIAGLEALVATTIESHDAEEVPVGDANEIFQYLPCTPDMGIVPDSGYRWAPEGLNPTLRCADL